MDINGKRRRHQRKRAPINGKTISGADVNGIDRISNLPDEILCHILSFMPTKFAVTTCILSTRWRNLFPLIPNLRLRLDDALLLHPESPPSTYPISFMNFAYKLLDVTLHDVPSIYYFCLICQKIDDGKIIADWIRAALRLNVKTMDLRLDRPMNFSFLFDSLLGCNITSLSLLLRYADDAPEFWFSLPNLKMLIVHYMKFRPLNALLACCPVLETLVVNRCYCLAGETLGISIPSLKALQLISGICSPEGHVYGLEGGFEIDAPKLEYFSYGGFLANRYSATRWKSRWMAHIGLDKTFIQYPYDAVEKAVELVKVCADAEKLSLSKKIVKMLHHYPHPLPMFRKMTDLSIRHMGSYGWELLARLLECAPNLNKLYLKTGLDSEGYKSFKASLREPMSIHLSRRSESCTVLEIRRKGERSSSSLPTCSAVHS